MLAPISAPISYTVEFTLPFVPADAVFGSSARPLCPRGAPERLRMVLPTIKVSPPTPTKRAQFPEAVLAQQSEWRGLKPAVNIYFNTACLAPIRTPHAMLTRQSPLDRLACGLDLQAQETSVESFRPTERLRDIDAMRMTPCPSDASASVTTDFLNAEFNEIPVSDPIFDKLLSHSSPLDRLVRELSMQNTITASCHSDSMSTPELTSDESGSDSDSTCDDDELSSDIDDMLNELEKTFSLISSHRANHPSAAFPSFVHIKQTPSVIVHPAVVFTGEL